ncbi:MAG TPA: AAA family ATPase, partial [Polyangiaceae bacterium]|nr:AAA family ATPase [Polyangiaceae bacterium]
MATIHFVLQGKGGVGKSFVAATMAQFLRDRGSRPLCIDTDPINKTFAGYKAFDVHRLELMDGSEVDPRRFDALVELLTKAEPDQHVIIDNGASSFIPLADYLLSCEVPAMLQELGHALYLHCVITGGQGQVDTLQGLSALLASFSCPCVVWLNPWHGRIEHEGKGFEEFALYQKRRER